MHYLNELKILIKGWKSWLVLNGFHTLSKHKTFKKINNMLIIIFNEHIQEFKRKVSLVNYRGD